jgi:hypothetical protein
MYHLDISPKELRKTTKNAKTVGDSALFRARRIPNTNEKRRI